jgi:hypothetical protein
MTTGRNPGYDVSSLPSMCSGVTGGFIRPG